MSEENSSVIRCSVLLDLAIYTFGDEKKAIDWLRTSNRALGGKTPFEVATNSGGTSDVEKLLGRIAYGVIS